MSKDWKILITDYAWSSIEPEREIISQIGGEVIVADSGTETELLKLAPSVDAILTCWKPVQERILNAAEKCQIISRYGIGVDNINVESATEHGIIVTNVPKYCVDEVSEHTFALLLSCVRQTSRHNRSVRSGKWDCTIGQKMYRLRGKTLGVIGFGNIAKSVIQKAKSFGLEVIVYSPRTSQEEIEGHDSLKVSFETLLSESDIITIHAPLTHETHHMFRFQEFRQMKKTAYLINTARGAIVDSGALEKALNSEEIAGAGIDVLEAEPPYVDEPLLYMNNVVITPHSAFVSEESIHELQVNAANSVVKVLSGQLPETVINPAVLEQNNLRANIT
ncbi:C-terminal binding protein [Candidatus Poribacteria bacterium]|nr:C-terminal binding protein [Candidatus Poribacteria bacterium]